jgi:beta-lactamase superfamily II metal-dependent hydrolase
MIFSLDVRRAHKGDCLLLHFGTKADPGLMLIDGGPDDVYGPHLKPRLEQIRKARGLGGSPLPIDLLMVSHVDDDHIRGILDFTKELRDAGASTPFAQVSSFWHNSFDEVIGKNPKELTAAMTAQFGAAATTGELPDTGDVEAETEEDAEVVVDTMKVLASIEQGHRLRGDAKKLGFQLNPEFDGKLVMASAESFEVGDKLTFTVAGPLKPELLKLQEKHDEWLKEQQAKPKKPTSALAAYADRSVPNLSSIVVLAESGGKTMLLTGDARGDKILKGLEEVELLAAGGTLHVNVMKVPHHGSSNNVAPKFFERITADHYVMSGDGEHGNPERETMEMLFAARGKAPFEIHLTYPIDEIDKARKIDWEMEQAKEVTRKKNGTSSKEPRPDWSPAKHSLKAFFKPGRLAPKQKLRISMDNGPHVIDLGDKLGF